MTPEQYLDIERPAAFKSEYCDGQMLPMAAGEAHNMLVLNLSSSLHQQLRTRDCRIFASEMRIRVAPDGLYTYPDIAACCGERKYADVHNELYSRQPDGSWNLTEAAASDGAIALKSIACTVLLSDLYENVPFEASAS